MDVFLDGGREVATGTSDVDSFSGDNESFAQDAPGVNSPGVLKDLEPRPIDIAPPTTKRYTATRFQYRFKDVPGWVIPESGDRFQMALANGAGPYTKASGQTFIQLTAGFYATLHAFVTHLKAKVDAFLTSNPVTIGTIGASDTVESKFKLTPNPVTNLWVDSQPLDAEPTNDGTYTTAELQEHHRTLARFGLNGNPSQRITPDYWETDDYDGATTWDVKSPVKQSALLTIESIEIEFGTIGR
jgi:hypothetical protein